MWSAEERAMVGDPEDGKRTAARRAVAEVQDGMRLGLGTGTTATFVIDELGRRVREEGLRITGVPSSERTAEQARAAGIPLVELTASPPLDLTIDGADEVDPHGDLIKGGGGALLREKLVAVASRQVLIVCDDRKRRPFLGAFPLPVVVVPFGWQSTQGRLERFGHPISLRMQGAAPFVTDDGLSILDVACERIDDPAALEREIRSVTGVVEVGLFVGLAHRVLFGFPDGHVEEWVRAG
jgi:ribose 5-phosphate isomerase A